MLTLLKKYIKKLQLTYFYKLSTRFFINNKNVKFIYQYLAKLIGVSVKLSFN